MVHTADRLLQYSRLHERALTASTALCLLVHRGLPPWLGIVFVGPSTRRHARSREPKEDGFAGARWILRACPCTSFIHKQSLCVPSSIHPANCQCIVTVSKKMGPRPWFQQTVLSSTVRTVSTTVRVEGSWAWHRAGAVSVSVPQRGSLIASSAASGESRHHHDQHLDLGTSTAACIRPAAAHAGCELHTLTGLQARLAQGSKPQPPAPQPERLRVRLDRPRLPGPPDSSPATLGMPKRRGCASASASTPRQLPPSTPPGVPWLYYLHRLAARPLCPSPTPRSTYLLVSTMHASMHGCTSVT